MGGGGGVSPAAAVSPSVEASPGAQSILEESPPLSPVSRWLLARIPRALACAVPPLPPPSSTSGPPWGDSTGSSSSSSGGGNSCEDGSSWASEDADFSQLLASPRGGGTVQGGFASSSSSTPPSLSRLLAYLPSRASYNAVAHFFGAFKCGRAYIGGHVPWSPMEYNAWRVRACFNPHLSPLPPPLPTGLSKVEVSTLLRTKPSSEEEEVMAVLQEEEGREEDGKGVAVITRSKVSGVTPAANSSSSSSSSRPATARDTMMMETAWGEKTHLEDGEEVGGGDVWVDPFKSGTHDDLESILFRLHGEECSICGLGKNGYLDNGLNCGGVGFRSILLTCGSCNRCYHSACLGTLLPLCLGLSSKEEEEERSEEHTSELQSR